MAHDFDRQWRRVLYALVLFSLTACSTQLPESEEDPGACETCGEAGAGPEAGGTNDSSADAAHDAETDSAVRDATTPDAQTADATTPDAQTADANDSGIDDASVDAAHDAEADSTPHDATAPDATVPDAQMADANDAETDSATNSGSLCTAPGCAAGQTMCGGLCISSQDPVYGCGVSSCQPCALPHAEPKCSANVCAIGHCQPGWADCNGNAADGCEADLSSAVTCGACATACSGANNLCAASGCVSACTPPLTLCTDRCVNLATDPDHCGACAPEIACGSVGGFPTCSGGQCGISCFAGLTQCGANCVDTTRDPLNCGTCGTECRPVVNAAADCTGSTCAATCQPGWTLCGDGCLATQSDTYNCGACGNNCGADGVCAASECRSLTSLQLAANVTVFQFALDATSLYWTDGSSTVSSVPIGGGAVTPLAQGQAKPLGISVDDTYVYWANNLGAAIMRTPKDGSGSPELVAAATQPTDVAVDATYAYWIDSTGATVSKAAKAGSAASVVLTAGAGATFKDLISSPQGAIVLDYLFSTTDSQIVNVSTGWSSMVGFPESFIIVQDGSSVYGSFAPDEGLQCILVDSFDLSTGVRNGAYQPGCVAVRSGPAAANSCGMFYGDTLGLKLLHPTGGTVPKYSPTVLEVPVDTMVADDAFLYFHSGSSIYKLPMP